MKRLIVGSTNWTWRWELRHFPKPGDRLEVGEGVVEEIPSLAEIVAPLEGVEDVRIRLPRSVLPDKVEMSAPGDAKSTRFHLTGEPREPYTISDSFELLICDAPVRLLEGISIPVIEVGWQSNADSGIRIVTPEHARQRFGNAPEAFTAGGTFQATLAKPVLYVLGGGGAVWLTSVEPGIFWQDDSFSDWRKTIVRVTEIVTTHSLTQHDAVPRIAMELWQEHRTFPPT